jgi:HK97 family phage major capsid protein
VITRTQAQALIPEEVSREIAQNVAVRSTFMQLARRLPNMSRNQHRIPVLSSLPDAYFVNGDTGLKQTTEMEWSNVYINAEEIAVIVPIPEAVLDDADYDIWAEARPQIEEAFGRAIDMAVYFGTNRPTNWPTGIVTQAVAAGNDVDLSNVVGAGDDIYDALLGETGVWADVENDGYAVTGAVSTLSMRGRLRGLRDSQGNPIFKSVQGQGGVQGATSYELDGVPINFLRNISEAEATALLIAGDWNRVVYSIRQDMTFKLLDQAVIQNNDGSIKYNLAQQDMVALRVVMRLGWALPNPASRVNPTAATRCPFGVLVA